MDETQIPVVKNPLMSYTIREDGVISVYAAGDQGQGSAKLTFDDVGFLESAELGFKDAAHAMNLYHEEGPDVAFDYVNEGAEETELTGDDLNKLLDGT